MLNDLSDLFLEHLRSLYLWEMTKSSPHQSFTRKFAVIASCRRGGSQACSQAVGAFTFKFLTCLIQQARLTLKHRHVNQVELDLLTRRLNPQHDRFKQNQARGQHNNLTLRDSGWMTAFQVAYRDYIDAHPDTSQDTIVNHFEIHGDSEGTVTLIIVISGSLHIDQLLVTWKWLPSIKGVQGFEKLPGVDFWCRKTPESKNSTPVMPMALKIFLFFAHY